MGEEGLNWRVEFQVWGTLVWLELGLFSPVLLGQEERKKAAACVLSSNRCRFEKKAEKGS